MNNHKLVVLLSTVGVVCVMTIIIEYWYYTRESSKNHSKFKSVDISHNDRANGTSKSFLKATELATGASYKRNTKDVIKTFYRASDITFGLNIMDDPFSEWNNFNAPACEGGYRCRFARNIEEADALIFQPSNIKEIRLSDYLKIRKPHQRWIFFSWESRINSALPPVWRHVFNWTATYMPSSDIYTPYGGGFRPIANKTNIPKQPSFKDKTKFAFAVYSNCRAPERNKLISELREYISIDIYGFCGKGKFPEGFWHVVELSKSYKFYLSFENCLCRDYLSEKYWKNSVNSYSVPVILGAYERKDVERVAPPNSFIYVNDFKTTKDLANFLIELSKDEKRYQKYLEWKNHYEVIRTRHSVIALCNICRRLHTDLKPSTRDLDKEWNASLCHSTSIQTKFDKRWHKIHGA